MKINNNKITFIAPKPLKPNADAHVKVCF